MRSSPEPPDIGATAAGTPAVDPIEPEVARQRLDDAIAPYLAEGWVIVVGHDYMARLNRGAWNLDFYVDLLGNVTVEKKALTIVQESGRLVAWLLLIVAVLLALALASALGWL